MKEKQKKQNDKCVGVIDREDDKLQIPKMYKVLMYNDSTTTMDFVIQVLVSIFKKSDQDAVALMLHIHNNGVGVCGVYAKDIAETKVLQVEHLAQASNFPLKTTIEEE